MPSSQKLTVGGELAINFYNLFMNKTESLTNCQAVGYEQAVNRIEFLTRDIEINELNYLARLGYVISIKDDTAVAEGSNESAAMLIADEIDQLISFDDDFLQIRDYLELNNLDVRAMAQQVYLDISELSTLQSSKLTVFDLIAYALETWVLTTEEKSKLMVKKAEEAREMNERSYK